LHAPSLFTAKNRIDVVAKGLPLTGLRNPVKLLRGLMKADAFKLDMILRAFGK